MSTNEAVKRPLYLVTGAAGFVGSNLVDHLAAQGYGVRAMVRKPEQGEALRGRADEVVVADITRPETLPKAVEGVDGIFHVAAIFRQEGVPDATFHEINVEGVRNIFEAAIAAGVPRIVHTSTNGVHSDVDHPPANETAPFRPADIYQRTKLAGEQVAMGYFEEGKIGGVALRPTMIWGPGDRRMFKLFRLIATGRFFYIGPGNAHTHWVDVRDLARAFELAMKAGDINAEAFLIGGREYRTLKEDVRDIAAELGVAEPRLHLPVYPVMRLAHATEIVCKPLGIEPPLFRRRVSFFLKNRAYDISKARAMLGYETRTDVRGEIADIVAWHRERGELPPAPAKAA
jgi:nucleoside-diphosphate-sugar epimerase